MLKTEESRVGLHLKLFRASTLAHQVSLFQVLVWQVVKLVIPGWITAVFPVAQVPNPGNPGNPGYR